MPTRTTVPPPFSASFVGVEGPYTILFEPRDEWGGTIQASIGGVEMLWDVIACEGDEVGEIELGGMTTGSEALWCDQSWFEIRVNKGTTRLIRYWGNGVIWREDLATEGASTSK